MRHLIEPVRRRHRADLHRLEQDVVARIAAALGRCSGAGQGGSIPGHGTPLSVYCCIQLYQRRTKREGDSGGCWLACPMVSYRLEASDPGSPGRRGSALVLGEVLEI